MSIAVLLTRLHCVGPNGIRFCTIKLLVIRLLPVRYKAISAESSLPCYILARSIISRSSFPRSKKYHDLEAFWFRYRNDIIQRKNEEDKVPCSFALLDKTSGVSWQAKFFVRWSSTKPCRPYATTFTCSVDCCANTKRGRPYEIICVAVNGSLYKSQLDQVFFLCECTE